MLLSPFGSVSMACVVFHFVTSMSQPQYLPILILWNFNHASPSSSLPTHIQYVTCHTRDNKTLEEDQGGQQQLQEDDKGSASAAVAEQCQARNQVGKLAEYPGSNVQKEYWKVGKCSETVL